MLEKLSKEKYSEWEEFNLRYGNVFQSIGFANTVLNSGGDFDILVYRREGSIVAGVVIFKILKGIVGYFTESKIVSGPVLQKDLVDQEKILKELLEFAVSVSRQRGSVKLTLKTPFIFGKEIVEKIGFVNSSNAPKYSFHVRLGDSKKIWDSFDKKTRNAIRKAEKNNVKIVSGSVDDAYNLYVAGLKGQIAIPKSYFSYVCSNLDCEFLVAEYDGIKIAESVFLKYGGVVYYFNNGSLSEYRDLNANSLLIWEMIKKSDGGNSMLSLYGVPANDSNNSSYGLYKFKSSFGGEFVHEFEYYDFVLSPFRKMIFNMVIKLYKKLRLRR